MTNKSQSATQLEREDLDFIITDTSGTRVLRWKAGGCRPAYDTEIAIWDELARLRADAARYRWLREQVPGIESPWIAVGIPGRISCFNVEYADEFIDKHMPAAPAGEKGK